MTSGQDVSRVGNDDNAQPSEPSRGVAVQSNGVDDRLEAEGR